MTNPPSPKKLRGRPVRLPAWWLEDLKDEWEKLEKKAGYNYRTLAEELTKKADRRLDGKTLKWDRKTIERFIEGESPTQELVDAFCAFVPTLIPPIFTARSRDEAVAFRREAAKFDTFSNPEKQRRREQLVEMREAIEQTVSDQTAGVKSEDEAVAGSKRAKGGGRARGVARGRSTPS